MAGGRAELRTGRDGRRVLRIGSVLDLRLASLLHPRPLRRLLRSLGALGVHSALLCGRLSAKMLLRRWGIAEEVTVVDSDEERTGPT